ncbi:amino acid ABC transporter permease [Auraticoccus monumenti]|uniref:Amino acid ABC transporter membrane protein, PAAT family n=1 Tax=Auraticoccus monumenti TaxID=675864 RepID=A0A1G7EYF0_9ACTN|nr:amino acid ABC transporter permease [Auraticoccus monumenti]SDE68684.1 amino acid ABC transporter membrane protein, PAAT family [Auraticoccus monumenti]
MTEVQLLEYVISVAFLRAALVTVALTVLSMTLGILGGLLLALGASSRFRVLRALVAVYVWLFRGTPVLLQLIFVFNVLPLVGLRFDSFTCAIIALSLNEAAYMAEVIRGGLMGVDRGQRTASHMLGLSRVQTMLHVVLPQMVRLVLPPTGNQLIGMLKTSALASVVAVQDLLLVAQRTAAGNFDYVDALLAAAIHYLLLTTLCTLLVHAVEVKMDVSRKSQRRQRQETRALVLEGGRR